MGLTEDLTELKQFVDADIVLTGGFNVDFGGNAVRPALILNL